MKFRKLGILATGLAVWYAGLALTRDGSPKPPVYPLPPEIKVVQTSLPYEERERKWVSEGKDGSFEEKVEKEKFVRTDSIDFSKDFSIETNRYRLVKDKDWLPSRLIGHTMAMSGRLLFWDWDYAWGQDEERSKAALSMLEGDTEIKDLTVRLNHNEALYDAYRMFADKDLRERNNFGARLLLGLPLSLFNELWAELSRGSYYNPLTRTVACYSNIEAVTAHEIGHHKDFQRFSSDWEYMLSRSLPPVMLYQEWQASTRARDELLAPEDRGQFNRYLIPAFFTYLLGSWYASRKILQKKELASNGDRRDLDKIKETEKPEIYPWQTARHMATFNAELYAGIAAYSAFASTGSHELLNYGAFIAGALGTKIVADGILKHVLPYNHELNGQNTLVQRLRRAGLDF